MASTSGGGHRNGLNAGASLEKLMELAHSTGDLVLTCRNLKSFPKNRCKYDLKDTVSVDLSKNKLTELPQECTDYYSLERLVLYHNFIRSIPDSVIYLQSLQFLDLSRNSLSYLPPTICELPLQGLIVNNNKLVSLPEEIGKMNTLMQLDASCNEITHLPVQIGDLASLKTLNLRRNHLQEIPIEISYLQLTTLDLSGNRIVSLPVELRFMTSVLSLNLGENPLTCPPANLISRGRFHVFKYLEIQAIKEDRKRGVLTDSGDYRRSYRKTAQLNDFRFASGFGADARRKRHTADSGYGSEQPLDRRWSQEFNQEGGGSDNPQHGNNADDTRRIIMRAANCQRSPRSAPPPLPEVQQQQQQHKPTRNNNPTPLTSTGSTTSSSSGYSSINMASEQMDHNAAATAVAAASNNTRDHVDYACHNPTNPNNNNSVIPIPTVSSSSNESSSGNCRIIPIIKEKPTTLPQPNQSKPQPQQNGGQHVHHETTRNEESPDDYEKEERRRAAHKVLGKQAQFKEQLRNDAATANEAAERGYHQQPRLTASALARMQQLQQGSSGAENTTALPSTTTRSLYDVKAMQKEAVLSYVKSKQGPSPARSVAGRGSQPDLQSNAKNSNLISNGTRAASTTSIPQRSPTGIIQKQALKNRLIRGHHSSNLIVANTRRAEVEKSASADAHINQLRMEIESRLRISLPEDISASLADGVILCHVANHVRPRAVPSIHVPSPSVPKLNTAKCRRNVENFLLACRKIGVREDLICSPSDILEPRKQGSVRVAISVSELLRFHHLRTT